MASRLGIGLRRAQLEPRWRQRLPEIDIPTLVVHGRRDPSSLSVPGRRSRARSPGHKATVVVSVPGQAEPWQGLANAAFRLLMDRTARKSIRQARRCRSSCAGRCTGVVDLTELGHPASRRGQRRPRGVSARPVFAAGSSSNVPEDEWGAGPLPLTAGSASPRGTGLALTSRAAKNPRKVLTRSTAAAAASTPTLPRPRPPGGLQAALGAGALRGHERQHIGRADPPRWLADHSEEHLSGHKRRPAPVFGRHRPARNSRYSSSSRTPQPHHDVTGCVPRPDQPHSSHRHAGPHLHKNRPVSLPRSLRRSPAYHADPCVTALV